MILVDSNTWVDCFNGVRSPHMARLDAALEDEEDLTEAIPLDPNLRAREDGAAPGWRNW